jgi:hypothetical protein
MSRDAWSYAGADIAKAPSLAGFDPVPGINGLLK